MRRTIPVLIAVVALLGAALPAAISAADFTCGKIRGIAFALDVPASFRSPGHHEYQMRDRFLDEGGNPVELITQNGMDLVPAARLYPDPLLLRVFSTWALEPDKSVNSEITEMHPAQQARFFAVVFYVKVLEPFGGQDTIDVRWETSPGMWSDWTPMSRSSDTAVCSFENLSVFKRSLGWLG